MISFVPDFGDTPVLPADNIKPIFVYERRQPENTTVPEPPDILNPLLRRTSAILYLCANLLASPAPLIALVSLIHPYYSILCPYT